MDTPLSKLLATPLYVVECYWPGITTEQLQAADERTRQALARHPGELNTRQVGSILIPADELVFRLFVGGTAQQVEATNQQADVPFERVVGALAIDARSRSDRIR